MFVLGLTGSLGMGKSTTAKMFVDEGIPVHDADAPGTTRGGQVDRDRLGRRVLGDPAALARLESIVHPLVAEARERFLADSERSGAPVAVLDIPLLYETGGEARCDAVVVVSAPAEVQRQRAFERPEMTEAKYQAILAKQMPDAEKRSRADFVVDTSRGLDAAREQVREILGKVARLEKRRRT